MTERDEVIHQLVKAAIALDLATQHPDIPPVFRDRIVRLEDAVDDLRDSLDNDASYK